MGKAGPRQVPVSCPGNTSAGLLKGLVRGKGMSGRTERWGELSPQDGRLLSFEQRGELDKD